MTVENKDHRKPRRKARRKPKPLVVLHAAFAGWESDTLEMLEKRIDDLQHITVYTHRFSENEWRALDACATSCAPCRNFSKPPRRSTMAKLTLREVEDGIRALRDVETYVKAISRDTGRNWRAWDEVFATAATMLLRYSTEQCNQLVREQVAREQQAAVTPNDAA
jgi:hypothetical protein